MKGSSKAGTSSSKENTRKKKKTDPKPKLTVEKEEVCGNSSRTKKISSGSPEKKNEGTINFASEKNTPEKQKIDDSPKEENKENHIIDTDNKSTTIASKTNPKKKKGIKRRVPRQPAAKRKIKKVRAKRKTKVEKINDQLKALGIEESEKTGNCARAAIYKGFIELTGNLSDLDQEVLSGKLFCGHHCVATLRKLLEQPDYAGTDYEDGLQDATVFCDQNNEANGYEGCDEGRTYVTGMCKGKPQFDCGKFHNHCIECKNFGVCIHDYRNMHCDSCGKHYFGGFINSYPCPCRERGGAFDGSGGGECSIQ